MRYDKKSLCVVACTISLGEERVMDEFMVTADVSPPARILKISLRRGKPDVSMGGLGFDLGQDI
jgi:hypothetical protein